MNAPIVDYDLLTDTSIHLDWRPITSDLHTGAVDITSYSLEWDQATGTWESLQGDPTESLALLMTVTDGVTAGSSFYFRLRAKNQHGWGPYSTSVYTIPCFVPSQMQPASLSIENIYVKVDFIAPSENGASIEAYRILIRTADGMLWLESQHCLSTEPSLLTNLYCYVPMEELTSASDSFNLPYNHFVEVKVQAYNHRGWGDLSNTNTVGVYAETVPSVV